jgi:hypothetical protein
MIVVTAKNTSNTGSNYNTVKRFGTRGQTLEITGHQGISSIKQDGKLTTELVLKANVMNHQFKSVQFF